MHYTLFAPHWIIQKMHTNKVHSFMKPEDQVNKLVGLIKLTSEAHLHSHKFVLVDHAHEREMPYTPSKWEIIPIRFDVVYYK